jgi:uncharacterized protein
LGLRHEILLLFEIRESPHRLSLAFALGIFIGMSPLLGLHTVLGVLTAYAFRLNKLATLVGVYVTNPWTIVPIYTFGTWIGARCLGMNRILPDIDWKHLTFSLLLNDLRPLLMPFVVGSFLTGAISALIGYCIVLRVAKRRNG